MENLRKEYESKLITAENAVKLVKSGDWVDFGWGVGIPYDLDAALAARIKADDLYDLKFRGGIALRVPEIFKIEDAPKHLCWNSWHMTGIERKAVGQGIAYYAPIRYSELPRYYRDLPDPVDIAMFRVAPMDSDGYFNFGPSASHMADMCSRAKCIVVEVNENMPVALGSKVGGEKIHISEIDHIVESTNTPMEELGAGPTNEIDEKVAQFIVEEIPNGACLQLGIGGMPNAVGSLIAKSDLKDLGVHTEMYVDAFVDIAMAGKINGSCKTIDKGRQAYAFGAGTKKLYDYINNNPCVLFKSATFSNDPYTIAKNNKFVSVNATLEIDLTGQCASETVGNLQWSGTGGQSETVQGAQMSPGGKSIIAMHSTYSTTDENGKSVLHSKIVPFLAQGAAVTTSRNDTDYVVTEYGIAWLRGLNIRQRVEELIKIAHPDFRDWLREKAEKNMIW